MNFLKKNKKVIVFLCILIFFIGELVYFASSSIPGESAYFFKKEYIELETALKPSAKEKAQTRLSYTEKLVALFGKMVNANPSDKHIIPLAQEIVDQETLAVEQMHIAKDKDKNKVGSEAHVLCESLEKQIVLLKGLSSKVPESEQGTLVKIIDKTNNYIDTAMMWK